MKLKKGFTLIELLVVIAIIGILAAIIFPVYARVKDSAYRGADMSNLNAIRTALQLYRTDQGAYPPALLGYATGYMNFAPTAQDVVPANLVNTAVAAAGYPADQGGAGLALQTDAFLYSKRVSSIETFRPAYDRVAYNLTTQAVWPQGLAPQRYGPTTVVQRCFDFGSGPVLTKNFYYQVSGYDVAEVPTPGTTAKHFELRYTPFWSQSTVPSTCAPSDATGSGSDNPRQLGYTDPPETTVITWDSYFREYNPDGTLSHNSKRDIVLFLGGEARMMDSATVAAEAWQVTP